MTLFLLILISFSFYSVKSFNLRKGDETQIPNLDTLLTGLPISYESLQKEFKSQRTSKKDLFSLSYFKSLESNSKIKYYLNKEKTDFDSIINDIINIIGIANSNKAHIIRDIFYDILPQYIRSFNYYSWMNFNFIITLNDEDNKISFGSIYTSLIEGKYYFIFCYVFEKFKVSFNGSNAVILDKSDGYKYIATSVVSSYYSKDLEYYDTNYILSFFNLVGYKIFGNKYNLQLAYPNIE